MPPRKEGRDSYEYILKKVLREYESFGTVGGLQVRDKKHALSVAKAIAAARARKGK